MRSEGADPRSCRSEPGDHGGWTPVPKSLRDGADQRVLQGGQACRTRTCRVALRYRESGVGVLGSNTKRAGVARLQAGSTLEGVRPTDTTATGNSRQPRSPGEGTWFPYLLPCRWTSYIATLHVCQGQPAAVCGGDSCSPRQHILYLRAHGSRPYAAAPTTSICGMARR
jgi:hypothetical protein